MLKRFAPAILAGILLVVMGLPALAWSDDVATAPAAWTVVSSPNASPGNNVLAAVDSVSASDVWSVGSADNGNGNQQPLIEHWDGTAWSVVPGPSVLNGVLNGVSAKSSRAAWAVGQSFKGALIERWNGTSWSIVPSPSPGSQAGLSGVSADPRTGQAWAAGTFTDPATGVQRTLTEFNP
jgi:hypothetical protein